MYRLGLIGLSLTAIGCARINPGYVDSDAESQETASDTTASSATSSSGVASDGASGTATQGGGGSSVGTGETDAEDPPEAWVFTDDAAEDFEAGELNDLYWSEDDAIELSPEVRLGTLRSRIFVTGGHLGRLTELEWEPPAPYGVGLFEPAVDEVDGYEFGGTETVGLELLLRFDLPGRTVQVGDVVPDASAFGNDGTLGGTPLALSRGVFGQAVTNPRDAFIDHPQSQLAPGVDEYTWTAWYRSNGCTGASIVSFDAPAEFQAGTTSAWIVCNNNVGCPASTNPDHGIFEAAALSISEAGAIAGPRACGQKPIDDGAWHHLAARMLRVNGGSMLELFVDGLPDEKGSPLHPTQYDFSQGPQQRFTTVGNPAPEHGGAGTYDEITVWNRPLLPSEIRDLHARGAARVEFGVRACAKDDCSDNPPFVGPEGDSNRQFLDSGPHLGHAHDLWAQDLVGVAFQYQLRMSIIEGAIADSPQIPLVTMFAEPVEDR